MSRRVPNRGKEEHPLVLSYFPSSVEKKEVAIQWSGGQYLLIRPKEEGKQGRFLNWKLENRTETCASLRSIGGGEEKKKRG